MFGKHPRNILAIITLDIFLILATTVLMEYLNLAERFTMLENTVQIATDMALDTSMSSEEFFSEGYQSAMTSTALSKPGGVSKRNLGASTILYRNGTWFYANTYYLSMYYEYYNKLPSSKSDYDNFCQQNGLNNSWGTAKVYEWLFGRVGQSYTDSSLSWANKSNSIKSKLADFGVYGGNRTPTTAFKNFYNGIGHQIKQKGVVKEQAGSDSFDINTAVEYPVLANMGLNLSSFNSVGSPYMTDNFCMSFHIGKKQNGRQSIYFLTPYSLGVTYVPREVFKPVFIANLDTMARLQKLAGGNLHTNNATWMNDTLKSADHCVEPDVYIGNVRQSHTSGANQKIVTDGLIEYDLNSVQVRVDYFLANFYSHNYRNTVARIEGVMSGYQNGSTAHKSSYITQYDWLAKNVDALRASDTTRRLDGSTGSGDRIVAKVTVKLKVYIPYQSSIIQWFVNKDVTPGAQNHYSVRTLNPTDGTVIRTSDGTWYQYSTYVAITR